MGAVMERTERHQRDRQCRSATSRRNVRDMGGRHGDSGKLYKCDHAGVYPLRDVTITATYSAYGDGSAESPRPFPQPQQLAAEQGCKVRTTTTAVALLIRRTIPSRVRRH